MTLREAQDSPLFANRRLQSILGPGPVPLRASPPLPSRSLDVSLTPCSGKLPPEAIQVVLEELRKNGGWRRSLPGPPRSVPTPPLGPSVQEPCGCRDAWGGGASRALLKCPFPIGFREPGVVRQEQNQFSDNVEKTRGMGEAHLSVGENAAAALVHNLGAPSREDR